MNKLWQQLSNLKDRLSGGRMPTQGTMGGMQPDANMAKAIVEGILATRADELSCDECFVQLDQFADMHLSDVSAQDALPLVEDHLKRCKDCREEFELLLVALEATA